MSRVKITEYRAKKIILGEKYAGVQVRDDRNLPGGKFVLKVDQGIKKRAKQGLLAVNVNAAEGKKHLSAWRKKGFSQFLADPLLPHDAQDEQYLSLERVREGIRMLHTQEGGVEIESHPEKVAMYMIKNSGDVAAIAKKSGIPEDFLHNLVKKFEEHFFAFLELNPLVVSNGKAIPLDAAALVDGAGSFFTNAWTDDDVVKTKAKHDAEDRIEELAATTPSSLKLTVLNPNGALFFLLSGGGGSIVIADEAQLEGVGNLIGNYGEYSGGPTREETYLYGKEVIRLMLDAHPRNPNSPTGERARKALVIAGGVANFTDVKKTFAGIIDALSESSKQLQKQGIKVFVRRGGPNEKAGLELMRAFLEKENLLGSIHGSDDVITAAVDDAIKFIKIVKATP